jgi:hypothetical protein
MLSLVFFMQAKQFCSDASNYCIQKYSIFNPCPTTVLAVEADLVVFYDRPGIESLTMYSAFQPIVRILFIYLFIYHEACILLLMWLLSNDFT